MAKVTELEMFYILFGHGENAHQASDLVLTPALDSPFDPPADIVPVPAAAPVTADAPVLADAPVPAAAAADADPPVPVPAAAAADAAINTATDADAAAATTSGKAPAKRPARPKHDRKKWRKNNGQLTAYAKTQLVINRQIEGLRVRRPDPLGLMRATPRGQPQQHQHQHQHQQ